MAIIAEILSRRDLHHVLGRVLGWDFCERHAVIPSFDPSITSHKSQSALRSVWLFSSQPDRLSKSATSQVR
jgi:hypothetical protein